MLSRKGQDRICILDSIVVFSIVGGLKEGETGSWETSLKTVSCVKCCKGVQEGKEGEGHDWTWPLKIFGDIQKELH